MKRLTAAFLTLVLTFSVCTVPAFAWIDVSPLDTDDFDVEAEDMSTISYLAPYDYNIADWLYATSPNGGSRAFWFDPSTDDTIDGVICTMRGITLGATAEDVAEAYGPALIDDEPLDDTLYTTAVSNGWSRVTRVFQDQAEYGVSYLYRYQPQWRVGEITFYFDRYDDVCLIYYTTGSWPNPTFLNNRQIAYAVQSELNAEGYSCGQADGVYGTATRNAIMAYQNDNGMDDNGVIDYPLLQDLFDEDELEDLLWDLDVLYGEDYGYDVFGDYGDSYDLIHQGDQDFGGEDDYEDYDGDDDEDYGDYGDDTGTWDIDNQI